MAQPWTAERVITADLARTLIEEQFPQLAPARVEPLAAGWDNSAFRVNEAFVFRFPRRQIVVPLIEAESRIMPGIASRLPLPVPVVTFVGRPGRTYPWPFVGHRMIPGCTACAANLNDAQRTALAVPLARFLAALHDVPAEDAQRLAAGPDPIAKLDLAKRIPQAREILARLAGQGLVEDQDAISYLLDSVPASFAARGNTLVHSDLCARHLLVDADNRLAGIIDWGDVHLGDAAVDLTIAHTFLPPPAHALFRQAYGPVSETTWHIARGRAVWHTLNVLDFAHATADADLLREGRMALGYLATTE
jgi:aminoglycoside phosphotransferase (APT) family kinase protein